MNKNLIKMGIMGLMLTGSTVIATVAMADDGDYRNQNRYSQNNATQRQEGYHDSSDQRHDNHQYSQTTQGQTVQTQSNGYQHVPQGNAYGYDRNHAQYQQPQTRYVTTSQPQMVQPQYRYVPQPDHHNNYRFNNDTYRNYGYSSRPQWVRRLHNHDYNIVREGGREYYVLNQDIYNRGRIIGRPRPGIVQIQVQDRTLEVIEATHLILDILR